MPVMPVICGRQMAIDAEYHRTWRSRNIDRNRANQAAYAAKRRAMSDAIKLKSGCADCGYRDAPEALQFDHVGSDKLFTIAGGLRRPWEMVLAEIAKCEVVCANCHAVRTKARMAA